MVLSSMQLQKVSVTLGFRRLQYLVLRSVLSVFINLRSAECVFTKDCSLFPSSVENYVFFCHVFF